MRFEPRYEDIDGVRWLIGQYVDVPVGIWRSGKLEPIPKVRYFHDGHGNVRLAGGLCRPSRPLTDAWLDERVGFLEQHRDREAAKEFSAITPEWYEDVLWSLVQAREMAAKWRPSGDPAGLPNGDQPA